MFYMILFIIVINLLNTIASKLDVQENMTIPPLGSNRCTWGPSYWCSSPEHAQECNFDYNECTKYSTE